MDEEQSPAETPVMTDDMSSLSVVAERLTEIQQGPDASKEKGMALAYVKSALEWLAEEQRNKK